MRIISDDVGHTGFVVIHDEAEATTIDLSDTVVASMTGDGRFIGLDCSTPRGRP